MVSKLQRFLLSTNFFLNNQPKFKKILFAPLDWGLGHATRCIPLIREFLALNYIVTIAASGSSLNLLKTEFPQLIFLNLNAYNIVYSKHKRFLVFKVAIQIPKILKAIWLEHKWLENLLKTQSFDAVISDNRYGFYSKKTHSVFITHQLQVKTIFKFTDNIIRWLIYRRINNFYECWVPDFDTEQNMAGALSHPAKLPNIPVKYIGPLSRFKQVELDKKTYKYFIIISGPEPQRTLFEQQILKFIKTSKHTFLVVLGKPLQKNSVIKNHNCKVYNHLSTKEIEQAFAESEYVISRCGYTTVMDILTLKKKSILIPTPGQTEQEYLAKHLSQQNWCYTFLQQDDFDTHLKAAELFEYNLPDINTDQYKKYIAEFVKAI